MQLAAKDTVFPVRNETIRLSVSLRAALRLSRRYGDFGKIIRDITAGNLTVMGMVISECSADRSNLADYLDTGGCLSVAAMVEEAIDPLIEHILKLAGIDPDASVEPAHGKGIPLAEYYTKLYRIATGWLHWTPEQAWDASPAEIVAAYEGHIEMLRATGVLKNSDDIEPGDSDAKRQLNAIGDLNNLTMAA